MSSALRLEFLSIAVSERPWRMRLPFHFGVVTMREANEIHVACRVAIAGSGEETGYSAELAVPKWFNKDTRLTPDETVTRLRDAVARVVALALAAGTITLADLDAAARADVGLVAAGLNGLEISFAVALLERAAVDAACRKAGQGFAAFIAGDGLQLAPAWPHGHDFALGPWLAALQPSRQIAVRHTVGLSDPLDRSDTDEPFVGGRAVALVDVIASDQVQHFKVKFAGGDGEFARLRRLAAILATVPAPYFVSLDANEAFRDVKRFADVIKGIAADPALATFWVNTAYLEQPFDRSIALDLDIHSLAIDKPLIIDESDDRPDSFVTALACGYRGISIKTCKGIGRAITNAALAARETAQGRPAFITAEDLSVQPGLALQQNIALAAALGLTHAERNGHHFGPGLSGLPDGERADFSGKHPDVYGPAAIILNGGALATASTLAAAGLGTAVCPLS